MVGRRVRDVNPLSIEELNSSLADKFVKCKGRLLLIIFMVAFAEYPGIREMLFKAEAQRTQRDLDTIQFRRDILTPADDRPPAVERA